jgi:outer membrane immunogenic protein
VIGEIMKSIFLGAIALVSAAAAAPAFAADLPVKSMAPVAPAYNWNGWYIGGNAEVVWPGSRSVTGYSGGPGTAALFAPGGIPTSLTPGAGGYLGGAQIGYNWQASKIWLVGLEADIQGGGYKGNDSISSNPAIGPLTTSVEQHSDWFGTVRGRFGLLIAPDILFYGTGGFAYGQAEASQSTVATGASAASLASCPNTQPCAAASANSTRYGWAAGAGYEIMMHDTNWIIRAEYLYVDLGVQLLAAKTLAFAPPVTFTSSNQWRENMLRIGFDYRFGGPVVAKY